MERDCDLGEMPGTVHQKLVEAPMTMTQKSVLDPEYVLQ